LHYGYGTADFPQPSVETLPRKSPIDTSESLLDHSDADSVDESIFSENENCGESSATSISPDTIGLIFENLLNYNDLRYLWPQFIFLEEEQARPQERIGKLLRLYAHRLKKLAKASRLDDVPQAHQRLELEAARFVRRSVSNLSQRIVEAHQEYVRWRPDIQPEVLHRGNRRVWSRPEDDEIDEDDDIDNEISDIAVAKTFLFETEPIRILEATVKTVVRPEVSTTNEWMVIRSLASLLDQSLELVDPPAVGTSRIRWTCVGCSALFFLIYVSLIRVFAQSCGEQLYDDFIETQPGGLKQLRNELRIYGKDYDPFIGPSTLLAPEPLDDSGSAAANGPRFLGPLKKVTQWSNTGYTRVVNLFNKTRLPRFRQEEWQTKELGTCNNTTAIVPGANTDHNFLLLCIPYMRMGTKLSQSEVCRINSDQEFVKLLRQRYVAQRKQSTTAIWKLLRKVCSIEFVKVSTSSADSKPFMPLTSHTDPQTNDLIIVRDIHERFGRHPVLSLLTTRHQRVRVRPPPGRGYSAYRS